MNNKHNVCLKFLEVVFVNSLQVHICFRLHNDQRMVNILNIPGSSYQFVYFHFNIKLTMIHSYKLVTLNRRSVTGKSVYLTRTGPHIRH